MDKFSDRESSHGIESYLSRNMLEKKMKKLRVSEDFCVAKNKLLKPGKTNIVRVRLEKSLFPPVDIILPWMFKHLEISMRSCFAQSGIYIASQLFDCFGMKNFNELSEKGSTTLDVWVMNRGLSDVQLKKWWAFFRLYFRPTGNAITGKALYDIIKEWKLKIEWAYGQTRSLVGSNIPDPSKEMTWKMLDEAYDAKELTEDQAEEALTLKLKLNGNVYIPDNKKKIIITSKKDLVDVLQPFDPENPRHAEHDFNIWETYYVDFGDYFGVIIYQWYDGWSQHIISPLIDPWFKGPIRTEIVKWEQFNDFIELHIYHKDGMQSL